MGKRILSVIIGLVLLFAAVVMGPRNSVARNLVDKLEAGQYNGNTRNDFRKKILGQPVQERLYTRYAGAFMKELSDNCVRGAVDLNTAKERLGWVSLMQGLETADLADRYIISLENVLEAKEALARGEYLYVGELLAKLPDETPIDTVPVLSSMESLYRERLEQRLNQLDLNQGHQQGEAARLLWVATRLFPQDRDYAQRLSQILPGFESSVEQEVSALVSGYRHFEAERRVAKALEIYPESSRLKSLQNQLQGTRPVRLSEISIMSIENIQAQTEDLKDLNGDTYSGDNLYVGKLSAYPTVAWLQVNLRGEYRHLHGIITLPDTNTALEERNDMVISFFPSADRLEGTQLYTTGVMSSTRGAIPVDLDLTGLDTLYIYMKCGNIQFLRVEPVLADFEFYS